MRQKLLILFLLMTFALTGCRAQTQPAGLEALINPLDEITLDFYPTAAAMENGTFSIAQTDYASDTTHLLLYDGARNTLIREVVWDQAVMIVPSLSESSLLVLQNPVQGTMYLVNSEFEVISTVPNAFQPGLLSKDRTKWYYTAGEFLFQMDLYTGIAKVMTVPENLGVSYLCSIDPQTDALILKVYCNSFGYDTCTAVLDPESEEFRYYSGSNSIPVVMGNQMILQESPGLATFLSWGDLGKAEIALSKVDISKIGVPPANLTGLGNGYLVNNSGAAHKSGNHYLYRLGEKLEVWNLTELGLPEDSMILTQMADSNWLLCLQYTAAEHRLYLLDLNRLPERDAFPIENTIRVDAKERYALTQTQQAPTWGAVSPGYEEARAYADQMEETYGITIYMENQCAPLQDLTLIPFSLSYAPESTYLRALGYIEDAIRRYPSDFFQQFRQTKWDGIILLLTGSMESDYGAIGFEEQFRNAYVIALDVNGVSDVIGGTFCHEIWHATEDLAAGKIPLNALQAAWNQCNPPDFSYTYEHSDKIFSKYAYLSGSKDIYFADNYSCTYPTEDRARIMEYAMWYPEHFEIMLQYAPIRQKLSVLQKIISECFDTSAWDTPRWEQY